MLFSNDLCFCANQRPINRRASYLLVCGANLHCMPHTAGIDDNVRHQTIVVFDRLWKIIHLLSLIHRCQYLLPNF